MELNWKKLLRSGVVFLETSDIKDDLKKEDVFQELDEASIKCQTDITKFQDNMTILNSTFNTAPMTPGAPSADSSGTAPGKEHYINRADK